MKINSITDLQHLSNRVCIGGIGLQKPLNIADAADNPTLQTLAEREEHYVKQVLALSEGNRSKAANILGIDRVSLWRKLKKYGLTED